MRSSIVRIFILRFANKLFVYIPFLHWHTLTRKYNITYNNRHFSLYPLQENTLFNLTWLCYQLPGKTLTNKPFEHEIHDLLYNSYISYNSYIYFTHKINLICNFSPIFHFLLRPLSIIFLVEVQIFPVLNHSENSPCHGECKNCKQNFFKHDLQHTHTGWKLLIVITTVRKPHIRLHTSSSPKSCMVNDN